MRYIDAKQIYSLTNQGLTIFEHLHPNTDFSNPKKYFKRRTNDKTASSRVIYHEGFYQITDFGDQQNINGMKAIPYLMHEKGYEFYDALLYIEEVIIGQTVDGSSFKPKKWAPDYEKRKPEPGEEHGQYSFTFKKQPTLTDCAAIGRYVNPGTLARFNIKAVAEYSLVGKDKTNGKPVVHIFKATDDYPIFLIDNPGFQKIYKPHEKEKKYRFVYVGTKPKDHIFGLGLIKDAPNEFVTGQDEEEETTPPAHKPNAVVKDIFRCSGESDALNLASLGFHVYWLNSESAELTYQQFKEIDELCENHYQVMDLDATGQQYALKNALQHYNLYTVELPLWLKTKNDWRGNPCKDLKDFINISGTDADQTTYQFNVLKKNARRIKFWETITDPKNKKKKSYNINMEFFYFFLKANGFYQMESQYHKKAGYSYVHIQGKVVEIIHPDNIKRTIKRFTKDWIKKKQIMEGIELLNKINTSAQITEGNLETIEEIKLNFKNHDKETEYINFANASLKITPHTIESVKHDQLPNYILGKLEVNRNTITNLCPHKIRVLKNPPIEVKPSQPYQELLDKLAQSTTPEGREQINAQIQAIDELDRYQVIIHDHDFIFSQYLKDLAAIHWKKRQTLKDENKPVELTAAEEKEENLVLASLLFSLGYLCQQYKSPDKPWIVFLQDFKISEIGQASGRSGKSILSKAPYYLRAGFYIAGRPLDNKDNYKFIYDGFTEFHDYIEVDDLAEFADFSYFYTEATGKRYINPKNYAPFTLEYTDSGKMLISSNFELPNTDNSTIARILSAGVSDYYHEATRFNDYRETRNPFTKFGKMMYDDFTDQEWVKFFNQMAHCIQMSMRFHKIQPPMLNLIKRQARRTMAQGLGKDEIFLSWATDYFVSAPLQDKDLQVSPAYNGYLNKLIIKQVAFENFQERLSHRQKQDYRITRFKQHIIAWCEYMGFEFNPKSYPEVDDSGRIMKSIDGSTKECFYICTRNAVSVPPPPKEQTDISTQNEGQKLNLDTHETQDLPF